MSLDELNQRVSVTTIKPVVFDGKRVVAEKNRIEEVANRLCEQFGGRLKSLELDIEHPVRQDEMVLYHDGIQLHHYQLSRVEELTAYESVECVGLVLNKSRPSSEFNSVP